LDAGRSFDRRGADQEKFAEPESERRDAEESNANSGNRAVLVVRLAGWERGARERERFRTNDAAVVWSGTPKPTRETDAACYFSGRTGRRGIIRHDGPTAKRRGLARTGRSTRAARTQRRSEWQRSRFRTRIKWAADVRRVVDHVLRIVREAPGGYCPKGTAGYAVRSGLHACQ
jgi:hypothetical protein